MGNGNEDTLDFDDWDRCICGEELMFDAELGFICINPLCVSTYDFADKED